MQLLLIVAAINAQFGAVVADTGGSGALITELTKGRISPRNGFVFQGILGLALGVLVAAVA